jgi:hypothetical protein
MSMSYDISFVVQGPIVAKSSPGEGIYSTRDVLASIRKFFPDSEIILSTWKGSDIEGLIYDELVLSDDPGGFKLGGLTMNYNRLIVSTKTGIQKASRKYVVKTRSDITFTGNQLLEQLQYITPVKSKYAVFNKFVLSTIFYVRNPVKLNLVFHPSDIFLVGEKEDVLSHFDVPLPERDFYFNPDDSTKIVSEQYFFVHNIFKKTQRNYVIPKWGYINLRYFIDSERYLFNNFVFLDTRSLGIEFPKRLYAVYRPKSNYTLKQAQTLSKVYQGKTVLSKPVIFWRGLLYFGYQRLLYYPKVAWHDFIKPSIHRLKYYFSKQLA